MACIARHKIRNDTYLYRSESYRDEGGNVKTKTLCVGKIDRSTGIHIYNKKYIESLVNENLIDKSYFNDLNHDNTPNKESINNQNNVKSEVNEIITAQVNYGTTYLLDYIAETTGLKQILMNIFPSIWKKLLTLAYFFVHMNEPALYCKDWLIDNYTYFTTKESLSNINACDSYSNILSSQRICELYKKINQNDIYRFFNQWGNYIKSNEFIALDITSVSSYSDLIINAEMGYNRDHDDLKQINICLLFGEKSGLPVYCTIYNGSLNDVSTLKTTLEQLNGIKLNNLKIVLDKGFYSAKNIDYLLAIENYPQFAMSVPFTSNYALKAIEGLKVNIINIKNAIEIGQDIIYGVTKKTKLSGNVDLNLHIYYNPSMFENRRKSLTHDIFEMMKKANLEPEKYKFDSLFAKYFNFRKSKKSDNGYLIKIKDDIFDKLLYTKGWMLVISNSNHNVKDIINIYRTKDVVEKGFDNLKNNLQLHRLNVHSDEAMNSKVFISFLSLLLLSHIHKVMTTNQIYKNLTLKQLLKKLSVIKAQVYQNKIIISPLSKTQRTIFQNFNCPLPVSLNI
jgi:transposase